MHGGFRLCFASFVSGSRQQAPTARAASASRLRAGGWVRYKWRDFSAVEHAWASRHGDAPAAGLAASRRPRRHRQQLRRCSGGLRQRAGPCLLDVPFRPQMLAAPRRPSRGVPVRPKCLGMIRPGRPFKAVDACGWRPRAQEPSGEHGLRGVARAFCVREREERKSFPCPDCSPKARPCRGEAQTRKDGRRGRLPSCV